MAEIRIISYSRNFKILDLNMFKNHRRIYEASRVYVIYMELLNNMFVHRWGKATKQGTMVKFKAIETTKDFEFHLEKFKEHLEYLKKEFDLDFGDIFQKKVEGDTSEKK